MGRFSGFNISGHTLITVPVNQSVQHIQEPFGDTKEGFPSGLSNQKFTDGIFSVSSKHKVLSFTEFSGALERCGLKR